MLEFMPMLTAERGSFQNPSQEGNSRPKRQKADSKMAVNFIGRVLREKPELMEDISLRDRYILLAHSDFVNPSACGEIGKIFGINTTRTQAIFNSGITKLWRGASSEIQSSYDAATIIHEVGLGYQIIGSRKLGESNKGKKYSPERLKRFRQLTTQRWQENPQLTQQSREHLEKLHISNIGRKHTTEARSRMSISQKKRFEDPYERARIHRLGEEGRRIKKEAKLKSGKLKSGN